MSVRVIAVQRNSPVLTPSSIACLSTLPTINLTVGCAHHCAYCYIQGYAGYPGGNAIRLWADTLHRLRSEIARAARRPHAVYFSPSSDAFQPVAEVLEMAHGVIETLLDNGIGVSLLTKGLIPERTRALLARHADLVRIQAGLISIDQRVTSWFERDAAPALERIEQIRRLVDAGIHVEARLDPILPGISDDRAMLSELLDRVAAAGVRTIAASALFLRPAIVAAMRRTLPPDVFHTLIAAYTQGDVTRMRGGTPVVIQSLPRWRRAEILDRVREVAAERGTDVRICACKNQDLASGTCNIAGTYPLRAARDPQLAML